MLVLSRFRDQSVVIETSDGPIEVTITRVDHHGKVRLGISAPKHVPVHRREVYDAIQMEKRI